MILLSSFSQLALAQFKIGLKGGINTSDLKPSQLAIHNVQSLNDFTLAVKDANYGLHFGLLMQAQIGNFFIQPELLFNSNSVDFSVRDIGDGVTEKIFNEKYQYLDIPLLMGFKFGPLRLGGGPVGRVFLHSKSELFDIKGYSQKFDDMTYAWQAGMGLDLGRLMLDMRYQGSFQNFGEHIVFGNQQFNFDDRPGGFIASLGFTF